MNEYYIEFDILNTSKGKKYRVIGFNYPYYSSLPDKYTSKFPRVFMKKNIYSPQLNYLYIVKSNRYQYILAVGDEINEKQFNDIIDTAKRAKKRLYSIRAAESKYWENSEGTVSIGL
jgi:hypothetical protein